MKFELKNVAIYVAIGEVSYQDTYSKVSKELTKESSKNDVLKDLSISFRIEEISEEMHPDEVGAVIDAISGVIHHGIKKCAKVRREEKETK